MTFAGESILLSRQFVTYQSGPGAYIVHDYRDLWSAMFRVVAFAMHMRTHGVCTCGCKILECDYCAHECSLPMELGK